MSKKFTGITSAGSAIPVYDKDAHSALEQKLDTSAFSSVSGEFATVDDVVAAVSGKADTSAIPSLDGYATQEWVGEQGYLTEVPESAVSGFATHEEVESATSGKLDASASGSLPYVRYTSADSAVNAPGAMSYYRDGGDRFFKVNDLIDAYDNVNNAGAGHIKTPNFTANAYGVSGGRTSTGYSGSAAGAFRIYANQNGITNPYIQLIGAASYTGNGVFVGVDSACGIDSNGRKTWNIKNGQGDTNPSFNMEGAASAYGNGVFIDVYGASGVDYAGNVKWQVGGPAKQLLHGAGDPTPGLLFVSPPIGSAYSANYSAVPHLSATETNIEMSYGPTASTPNIYISPNGFTANYTSAHAVYGNRDATISLYTAYNDPDRKDWSLTGSVQKREIECDSATSAITAIAGSAVGGGSTYSAGANIDITDDVISGKDWTDEIASATSGLMQTSGLEYDGDKISGYMGSAFKAGTDLEFEYDSADNISAINSSAISTTPSQALYAKSPLVAGVSGTSSFIGVDETVLTQLIQQASSAVYNETVLWSGDSTGSNFVFELSGNISDYNYIEMYATDVDGWCGYAKTPTEYFTTANRIPIVTQHYGTQTKNIIMRGMYVHPTSDTSLDSVSFGFDYNGTANPNSNFSMKRIVGIGRKEA